MKPSKADPISSLLVVTSNKESFFSEINIKKSAIAEVNVASASTITLPHNSVIYLTGTTTINVMNGRWANRVVRVVAIAGLTLAAGPGGVATTTVLAVGQAATLTWGVSLNGWVVG